MKITALEIKQHEFEKSFRGYNIEEVDIFLNSLANEWERTSNEARMLRMQLEIAEKEAAKLREVEMSLIKTLQTAETTSSKITEQARIQAEKEVEEARLKAEELLNKAKKEAEAAVTSAREEAENLVSNAESEASGILDKAKSEVTESEKQLIGRKQNLEESISELESYKSSLIEQLKALSSNTLSKIESLGITTDADAEKKTVIETPQVAAIPESVVTEQEEEQPEEAEEMEIQGIASSANTMVLEEESEVEEEKEIAVQHNSDDFTIIEGIGPKIDEVLKNQGIKTFRDLAIQPAYKIKELLTGAGPTFAMHDPGTWAEQARLASAEKWDELEALKEHLIAGKEPEATESNTQAVVEESPKADIPLTGEQATEEMLDRVNKVKAALKKAMQEKNVSETPKPVEEKPVEKKENSGSFFDNL